MERDVIRLTHKQDPDRYETAVEFRTVEDREALAVLVVNAVRRDAIFGSCLSYTIKRLEEDPKAIDDVSLVIPGRIPWDNQKR